jgi:GT2 family glycosyltransferase
MENIQNRSLRIQSIIYNSKIENLIRSLDSIERACDIAIANGIITSASMNYGDCSPMPVLTQEKVNELLFHYKEYFDLSVVYFNNNLGSACGHNTLTKDNQDDYILIMNPDVILAPDTLMQLFIPFDSTDDKIGIVEARQTPIEHPKEYNVKTGETSWASTACALIRNDLFEELKGFDADTFFLYCDDVDFSWRVRLAGYKVIFQPSAIIFHDKTFKPDGSIEVSDTERYYSAEAGLLMAYKWSNNELLEKIINYMGKSEEESERKALMEFNRRKKEGILPTQLDEAHNVAQFVDSFYAKHRFGL